jgi:hypothetical protein
VKRQTLNFLVDALALVGLVFLIATGLFLRYVLPPGSGRHIGVWGLNKHEWGDIHFWIAVFIISVMAVHLALHWRWIACVIQNKPREGSGMRAGLGIAGVILLLIISATPFLSPKIFLEPPPNQIIKKHSNEQQKKDEHEKSILLESIRGSMTLGEVEQSTNVPVAYILKELELPEDIPLDKKLGQLRQQYNFEMDKVRQILIDYDAR